MNSALARRMLGRLATVALLTGIAGNAFAAAPETVHASFVYVITNNTDTTPGAENSVAAFQRNPVTGQLAFIDAFPTGGQSGRIDAVAVSQHALVTDGQHLFAVNPGSGDISVFTILNDGRLQLLGSPVPSGGLFPISLAVKNNLLYVANVGDGQTTPANFTGFAVQNGNLTPIPGSTIELNVGDRPTTVVFNAAGTQLIGMRGEGTDSIDAFAVGSDGRLTETSSVLNQAVPIGAAFNPALPEMLLVANGNQPGDTAFTLSATGTLTEINTVFDQPAIDPCWVAFAPSGTLAWVSNFFSSSISLFGVAPNGSITQLSSLSTANVGAGSTDIALDTAGRFLYQVLSQTSPNAKVDVLQVTGNTINGGLISVGSADLPALSAPLGIVVLDR
jgi:6-phosphogluconolactonase